MQFNRRPLAVEFVRIRREITEKADAFLDWCKGHGIQHQLATRNIVKIEFQLLDLTHARRFFELRASEEKFVVVLHSQASHTEQLMALGYALARTFLDDACNPPAPDTELKRPLHEIEDAFLWGFASRWSDIVGPKNIRNMLETHAVEIIVPGSTGSSQVVCA